MGVRDDPGRPLIPALSVNGSGERFYLKIVLHVHAENMGYFFRRWIVLLQQIPHFWDDFQTQFVPCALNSATQMPLTFIETYLITISYNASCRRHSLDVKRIAQAEQSHRPFSSLNKHSSP